MQTRVLLVDDHVLLRKGLHLLLEEEPDLQVVGEAEDGERAVQLAGELTPDVVIMDITMPGLNGIEATRQILAAQPDTRILALSIHRDKQFVDDMLAAGAAGYVLKESVPEELVEGIRTVGRGKVYMSAAIMEVVVLGYRELLDGENAAGSPKKKAGTGPLLKTKLYCPSLSPGLIQRPRLSEFLDQNFQRPLTLITAPTGYGKSVLASSWVQSSDHPFAWIALDENDNDLHTFLAYLVAAIQKPFPEALPDTALLLNTTSLPAVPVLARTLVNELDRIPERFVLVLDDYHHIDEAVIHEFLIELLRHPLENLHLLLLTRTDPPFDLLTLQARQQMDALRAQALSFTKDETAAFLQEKMGMAVDEGVVKALTEKTEGWITGLILMTLSVRDSARLVNLSTTLPGESQTLDFLAAEALAHQPRDIQASLLKTSILDRFCASLYEVICPSAENEDTPISDGDRFIRWLTESNLFVIPLDDRGQWFRYHHLFQELLQSQLESVLETDEIAELHTRASEWFEGQGLSDEAIQHALAAGDIAYVVRLVEQHRYELMNTEQWHRLERRLKLFSPKTIEKNPTLLLTQAYIYEYRGQIAEAFAYRDRAEGLLSTLQPESLEQKALEGEIAVLRAEQLILSGEGRLAAESATQALELLPPDALHMWSYAIGDLVLANQMDGDIGCGLKIVNEIISTRASLPGIAEARMMLWFCLAYWMEGDLNGVRQSALQCLNLGEQHALPESIGFGRYFIGVLHYSRNELAEAERYLAAVVDDPFTVRPYYLIQSAVALALIYTSQGRDDEASNVVESMISYTKKTHDTVALGTIQAFQVDLTLKQEKIIEAQRLSKQAAYDLLPPLWFFYLPQLTPVKILLTQMTPESLKQALTQLDSLDDYLRKINRKTIRIDVLALQALIFNARSQEDIAFERLTESLLLAEPGTFIRNYVDLGPPMAALLKRLKLQVSADELGRFIDTILAAFPSTTALPVYSRESGLTSPLTEREMQVMRLLVSTLSAGEISDELVVSVNTVRMHTKNIYSKLEVHSRIEAVQRAREMGLI